MMEVKDNMGEKFHANLPAGRQGAKAKRCKVFLCDLVT